MISCRLPYKMIVIWKLLGFIVTSTILLNFSNAAEITKKQGDSCAHVSCFYNSMCVHDPSTDEPICICPEDECDKAPPNAICAGGVTYRSLCHVQTQMCKIQGVIAINHMGECGENACTSLVPCPFYGHCVDGKCTCVRCNEVEARRQFADFDRARHTSVCGSDGVTYDSECHMQYEACTSRTQIIMMKARPCHKRRATPVPRNAVAKSMENHYVTWRGVDPLEEANVNMKGLEEEFEFEGGGPCPKIELTGCLPLKHRRSFLMGIYSLLPGVTSLGSPVYTKEVLSGAAPRAVYISRYNSTKFPEGAWIVGSTIGTGVGWLGVSDPSSRPENIRGTWHSTIGPRNKPWVAEREISGSCVGRMSPRTNQSECDLGVERGPTGINLQSATHQTPLYELVTKRPLRGRPYRPFKRITVQIVARKRAHRFVAAFLALENSVSTCSVPKISKASAKFDILCGGTVIKRKDVRKGKHLKKVTFNFRAPPRGCITFKALVKSIDGKIYYDRDVKGSLSLSPLTQTICNIGHRKPKHSATPRPTLNSVSIN